MNFFFFLYPGKVAAITHTRFFTARSGPDVLAGSTESYIAPPPSPPTSDGKGEEEEEKVKAQKTNFCWPPRKLVGIMPRFSLGVLMGDFSRGAYTHTEDEEEQHHTDDTVM